MRLKNYHRLKWLWRHLPSTFAQLIPNCCDISMSQSQIHWAWFQDICDLILTRHLSPPLTDWILFMCEESVLIQRLSSLLLKMSIARNSVNFLVPESCIADYFNQIVTRNHFFKPDQSEKMIVFDALKDKFVTDLIDLVATYLPSQHSLQCTAHDAPWLWLQAAHISNTDIIFHKVV